MADLPGNLEFVEMVRGQAELNRKREDVKWLLGLITSFLAANCGSIVGEDAAWMKPLCMDECFDEGAYLFVVIAPLGRSRVIRFEIGPERWSTVTRRLDILDVMKNRKRLLWVHENGDSIIQATRHLLHRYDAQIGRQPHEDFAGLVREFRRAGRR